MKKFIKMPFELEELPVWNGMNIAMLTQLYYLANWKIGYFRGHEVQPFQIATSCSSLADKMGLSKKTVIGLLQNLEKHGVISRQTIGQSFSIITLLIRPDSESGVASGVSSGVSSGVEFTPHSVNSGVTSGVNFTPDSRYIDNNIDNRESNVATAPPASAVAEPLSPEDEPVSVQRHPTQLQLVDTQPKKQAKKAKAQATTSKRFTAPTLEEVKAYCQERGNNVDPEQFVDFYTSKDWKVGSVKMKDWKAAVRTWEKRNGFSYSKEKAEEESLRRSMMELQLNEYDVIDVIEEDINYVLR